MANQEKQTEALQIDLDIILRKKSGKRKVPRFVVLLLKRIVHQNFINDLLRRHHDKEGVEWSKAFLDEFDIKIKTYGEENIPESGRFIFAANHPMGGTESHVFMKVIKDHFSDIKFPVNDILMELKPMRSLFVPINKFGAQQKQNIQLLNDTFKSDAQILIFPAGLASRKIKGKIQDLDWKKTFITKAIQTKRDVIPVYIKGRNSNFFYNLANLRKWLGIKFNIEMIFLPGEVLKQRGATICLHFGKPVSYKQFDRSKSHKGWADEIRNQLYSMQDKK
ncbi:MAG: 1-acyl-sn-glycerol-3-phosphate acyltransferase [Bacteroidota bacterium]|nr:1-acyl-sn-glycerol-3-phosphate acyltransferase [Bacteroidota bacterium]